MQTTTEYIVKLPYDLTPWQKQVKHDLHRFKVACAGRRTGKTQLALDILIENVATVPQALGWYVAPTYAMAKDIAWGLLKHNTADFFRAGIIRRYYDGDLTIEFLGNRYLQLKSGDKPDSLRGRGLSFLAIDEPANMERELWEEVLRPAIADRQAPVFFGGTPKGFNWFYDLYQMELKEPNDWKSFRVTTEGAELVSCDEIEKARRDMDERAFRQEFEASFEVFGGQVFPVFNREKHTAFFEFNPNWGFNIGMDFGWSAPTAVLFIQVDNKENVYVFDELGRRETPIQKMGELIRERKYERKLGIWPKEIKTFDPDLIFCDPAGDSKNEATGTSSIMELRNMGFKIRYKKHYPGVIQDRISLIRKWLQAGKLIIHGARCRNLIQAMEMYHYPDPKNDIYSELPLKDGVSDHWIDALGEFFINQFPIIKSEVRAL